MMMAVPTSPRIGMAVAFVDPTLHGGSRAHPAQVANVSGDAVETLVVHLDDGSTIAVSRPMSKAAWVATGSDPNVAFWDFVDLS